ncbi:prepilin peptidase [Vibrio sp. PNB22_3_1]
MEFFFYLNAAVFGSFMNVVIARLPMILFGGWGLESVTDCHLPATLSGRSMCPKCGNKINWYQNIPIVSYFLLRGKCAHCNVKISFRYPLVEVLSVASAVLIHSAYDGIGLVLVLYFTLMVLIMLAFIDYDTMLLPDVLVALLGFLGLIYLFNYVDSSLWMTHALGVGLTYIVFALIATLYSRVRGFSGLGTGDVKLLMVLGFYLHPYLIIWVSFLSSILFIITYGLSDQHRFQRRPFGPFIISASVLVFHFSAPLLGFIYI